MMRGTTMILTRTGPVAELVFSRPEALNSMNEAFWRELADAFAAIDAADGVRAVVIASTGRHFTAGLDLAWAGELLRPKAADPARAREKLRRDIRALQDSITAIDRCRVPVIAAIQGGCIGGGVDLVTACDIRIGTADCFFTIQEVNVAIVADVGTLQRLPYLLPQGLVRELAFTGRKFAAEEARAHGLLNRVEADAAAALAAARALAADIAAKSPLAITGIKQVLNHGRGRTIEDGLDYVATWNAGMLIGEDIEQAIRATMAKQQALFSDLAG